MDDLDRLGDEIATLASHLSAATARWLRLIAEFDDRGGWVRGGYKTCAQWLGWHCGLAPSAAREHVRVAHGLQELPQIAACFEQVDEEELLRVARAASAAQLERIVRGYRTCVAIEQDADREWAEREVTWSWDETGALVFRGRVPAEQGALLVAAVGAARDELGPPPPETAGGACAEAGERSVSVRARNADALLALAQSSLAENVDASSADVYQVVVHVDAAALADRDRARPADEDASAARCELEDGSPLPVEAARRLGCDSSIVRVLERDGKPLSIGRKTRTISPALRRALRMRDRGCAFPGCTQAHHTDAHHIRHWADGGATDLNNLVQLCRHHHRLLHEGGFSVGVASVGRLTFLTPEGTTIPQTPRQPRGDCTQITSTNAHHRVRASAEALYPVDSVGERFELGWTVEALLESRRPRRE